MNETWRFLKFVLFSASAGIIEIGSFALLNELLEWPYWPSYLIALTLSVLWNFTLNRKFTFRSAANVPKAMLLNVTTEFLWQKYLVCRRQIDTAVSLLQD